MQGLDHVPIAVGNLEEARAGFEALGFAIKPGRPHQNGIRNLHVKFPDGTEVELITPGQDTDALSSGYRDWLIRGDGPAFLGLFAPDHAALRQQLSRHGFALEADDGLLRLKDQSAMKRLFFSRRQRSPSDRPEHFAHPNTAVSLSGVWLAGAEAERGLVRMLGGIAAGNDTCSPLGPVMETQSLPEAKLFFLPASAAPQPGRSIVALRISVRDVQVARSFFDANGVPYVVSPDCGKTSLWIAPAAAHGVWLELRQQAP